MTHPPYNMSLSWLVLKFVLQTMPLTIVTARVAPLQGPMALNVLLYKTKLFHFTLMACIVISVSHLFNLGMINYRR